MSSTLLVRFDLAQAALRTAIMNNLEGAVGYFDKQVDGTFNEILTMTPKTPEGKKRLVRFLLQYSCECCSGRATAKASKQKLLELMK